jgi:hypothetical protein
MSMHARPLTVIFYFVFALWATAASYSSHSFYSVLIAPAVGTFLTLSAVGLFASVVILAARRGVRTAAFPWLDAAIFAGAVVGFDLFWRFYLSPLAWDAFKLTSMALDVSTPVIVALGVAAVLSETRPPLRM